MWKYLVVRLPYSLMNFSQPIIYFPRRQSTSAPRIIRIFRGVCLAGVPVHDWHFVPRVHQFFVKMFTGASVVSIEEPCGMEEAEKASTDSPGGESTSTHIPQLSCSNTAINDDDSHKNLSKRALKRLMRQGHKPKKHAKKRKRENESDDAFMDRTKETSFYIENGLRKIYPYRFTFSTWAKERWYDRKLIDIFCQEFNHFYPVSLSKKAIETGLVKVNDRTVGLDYIVKNGDHIGHLIHRHEVPVTDKPIQIIKETDEFLVINKPASIPCHPCGSFRHNSVIFILERNFHKRNLRLVHRLDRLTSGLLVIAKTNDKAVELGRHISSRQLVKEYLCRVDGEFPSGIVECNEPLGVMSSKMGIQHVTPAGKESHTTFERLSYNGKSSVVKCSPRTGRTHQIRVHLQYLGHPIVNDGLYNTDCWGEMKGKAGKYGDINNIIERLQKNHDKKKYIICDDQSHTMLSEPECISESSTAGSVGIEKNLTVQSTDSMHGVRINDQNTTTEIENTSVSDNCLVAEPQNDSVASASSDPQTEQNGLLSTETDMKLALDPSKMTFDPLCYDCLRQFKDPKPEDLCIYLHAQRYKGPDWEFSAPPPPWAANDWQQ